MKSKFFKILGGYATLEDAVEANGHEALTKAVAHHFKLVTVEDILRRTEKGYTYKGKPLMDAQVKSLRSQAEGLVKSELFKVLELELQYQANQKMFTHSQNEMDMIAGKVVLWTWDVIKTKLHNI